MFLAVIIIISFSVWGGWQRTHQGSAIADGSASAFSIYGKEYTILEMQRLERYGQVMYMLQMFDVAQGLMQISADSGTRGADFVFNLLVLRHEMEKQGIRPTDAEAKQALEALPALQDGGKFSPQRAHLAEENLGMLGFDGATMLDVMKVSIGFNKLQDILAKNYRPSPLEVEKTYASRYQTAKIASVSFALEDFKKTAKVTDEEIKKYYDEKKDTYQTLEKRAASYVLFELPADLDSKTPEERQKIQSGVVDRVNQFNDASVAPGAKLEDIAVKLKEKVLTLAAFDRETPPEALKEEADVVTAIFQIGKSTTGISDPVKGTKGYYIFHLTQVEEPKQQDLAAVKTKVQEALVTQKAQEALSKAVNEARLAFVDGLKANKKVEDIAKEKNLTLSAQSELDASAPPQELPDAYPILRQVIETAAGQVTKAIDTEKGATLVYVYSKELRKREDSATLRKSVEDSLVRMGRISIFSAWFSKRREEAKIKMLIDMA